MSGLVIIIVFAVFLLTQVAVENTNNDSRIIDELERERELYEQKEPYEMDDRA